MANRIKITVMGNSYYISTDDNEARMLEIEAKLNTQLEEIADGRPNLSTMDAFVVLSLNLMDELSSGEESTDRMREQLTQYLEDAARARMELEDVRRENEHLRRELAQLRAGDGSGT